jgi:hypothetical protein
VQSQASTVEEYLESLPTDRRNILSIVRQEILKHLPKGYEEVMNWGMITYQVPLTTYPDTYNGQPLMFAALASQKNYMALYLMSAYVVPDNETKLVAAYTKAGKRLDMGKSCIRFKKLDDLELDAIVDIIADTSVKDFVEHAKHARTAKS